MLNAALVGLGWCGRELVRSVQGTSKLIRFVRGVTLEPEAAASTDTIGSRTSRPITGARRPPRSEPAA